MKNFLIVTFGLICIFIDFKWESFHFRITTLIGIAVTLMAIFSALGLGDFVLTFWPKHD